MNPYPHERQVEYWVSRAVEDYFDNLGYDIVVLPNTQTAEKTIPYDHLFAGKGIKIFGFQYKRLHQATKDYWEFDIPQYQTLSNFKWIYYALAEITSIRQRRNALHNIAIIKADSLKSHMGAVTSVKRILLSELGNTVSYYRWSGFVKNLFACKLGLHPKSKQDLKAVLKESIGLTEYLTDIYLVPIDPSDCKLALRISSSVPDNQEQIFDYDFGLDSE